MAIVRHAAGAAYTAAQARVGRGVLLYTPERGPGLSPAAAHGRSLPTFTGEVSATPVGHVSVAPDRDRAMFVALAAISAPHPAAPARMEP